MELYDTTSAGILRKLNNDLDDINQRLVNNECALDQEPSVPEAIERPASTPSSSKSKGGLFRKHHPRRSQHTDKEWEAVKEPIRQYYLDNEYTLPAVMDVMSKPPYNFHATDNMYKKKFKKWGFEKNVTQKRVHGLMNGDAVADESRKMPSIERLGQYFKRRKAAHDLAMATTPIIPELIDARAVEIDASEAVLEKPVSHPCQFVQKGSRRFRLEIEDELDGVSKVYYADSWGSREYHPLVDRQCDSDCPCQFFWARGHFPIASSASQAPWRRDRGARSHVFRVHCFQGSVAVDIQETALKTNLKKIVGEADPVLEKELARMLRTTTPANGKILLRCYRKLRDFLDNPYPPIQLSPNERLDLKLLVEGFLEDGDIWERIGLPELSRSGMDPDLIDMFLRQRLNRGIRSLDNEFKTADASPEHDKPVPQAELPDCAIDDFDSGMSAANGALIFELDATPASGKTFDLPTWESHRGFLPGVDPGAGPEQNYTSIDTLLNHLPGHYPVDGFYEGLSDECPYLLPAASRSPHLPIIFGEELHDIQLIESFYPTGTHAEEPAQQGLDDMLIAACRYGVLGTVRSLLDRGALLNCQVEVDGNTWTPLVTAIEANQDEIARHLALRGADPNMKSTVETGEERYELTPLLAATRAGNIDTMRLLLEHGAELNGPSMKDRKTSRTLVTPLNEAAGRNNIETFRFLLLWDTSYASGLKQANVLSEEDVEASPVTAAIFDAVKRGNKLALEQQMKDGVDVNVLSFQGTPLSVAASHNQPHIIKFLLEQGADMHLASLYLSRAGHANTAKALVQSVYGGSQNVRTRFIRQYERLIALTRSSRSDKLTAFRARCPNYREAWSVGIGVMDQICSGQEPEGPSRLLETLAFLAVARAVAETSTGSSGDMSLIDSFDEDLLRWQLLFTERGDRTQYQYAIRSLWGVDLSLQYFIDADYDDAEILGQFRGIISRLIDGKRGPLDLESSPCTHLHESFARWRQHRREPTSSFAAANGISPNRTCADTEVPFSERQASAPSPPRDTGPVAYQPAMNREQILEATTWLFPHQNDPSIFFTGVTGISGDLIRGAIFSIVFAFLYGLRALPTLYGVKLGKSDILGRFAIFLKFLGFLEVLETITPSTASSEGAEQSSVYSSENWSWQPRLGMGTRVESCNQWYSFIGSGAVPWM